MLLNLEIKCSLNLPEQTHKEQAFGSRNQQEQGVKYASWILQAATPSGL